MVVYVVPHKNPDTDSICAGFCYAYLKQKLGEKTECVIAEGTPNKETQFVFDHFKLPLPPKKDLTLLPSKQIILIDHNEPSQIPCGVKEEEIVEIIDHHKLGGLSLPSPIYVRIEPVGCSCSLVYKIFKEKGVAITPQIAQLLLAGILSDTLLFTSPTTTEEDKKIASELEVVAQANKEKLATAMFEAKSDLSDLSPEEFVFSDFKEYQFNSETVVGIGVLETTNPSSALRRREEILPLLRKRKKEKGYKYLLFGVVDILKQGIYFLLLDEEEERLLKEVFGGKKEDGVIFVPGVVSRKKQIVPPLQQYLKENHG